MSALYTLKKNSNKDSAPYTTNVLDGQDANPSLIGMANNLNK